MERKKALTRLACIGALITSPLILGGCSSNKSGAEVSSEKVAPTITTEQVTPSSLKVRYSADWMGTYRTYYDYIITRESSNSLLIIDPYYNSTSPYVLISSLEYSRSRGCDVTKTVFVTNSVVRLEVNNGCETCFPELK